MSLDSTVASEIQKLAPSAIIELFELDSTKLGGGIFRFHNGTNQLNQNLVWQGHEYVRFPIRVTGFETSGQGQFPRPVVSISNVMSAITTILLQYGDLIRAKFTRKRTFLRSLDAVNFPGGVNPTADPTVVFVDDIFYVDRKSLEDRDQVQFELSSAADLQNVQAPSRTIIKSTCPWIYRGVNCGYTGIPLFDEGNGILPLPPSTLALAMRAAYQTLLNAQATLAASQADLATKANTLTNTQKYSQASNFNFTGVGAKYYVAKSQYGVMAVKWNDVAVTVGTAYGPGAYQGYFANVNGLGIGYDAWTIIQYSRDEAAVIAAQAAYDAAVIVRDTDITNVATAQAAFDTALAAVPADDAVFTQDRCGKRLSSCKLRFNTITPNSPLPFGGFPGVAR